MYIFVWKNEICVTQSGKKVLIFLKVDILSFSCFKREQSEKGKKSILLAKKLLSCLVLHDIIVSAFTFLHLMACCSLTAAQL